MEDEEKIEHFLMQHKRLPAKLGDPGAFAINAFINGQSQMVMLDLGASVSILPSFIYDTLESPEMRATRSVIQLANGTHIMPLGMVENVVVTVSGLSFAVDFYIVDIQGPELDIPIILGRPFLNTSSAVINVRARTVSVGNGEKIVNIHVRNNPTSVHHPTFLKERIRDSKDIAFDLEMEKLAMEDVEKREEDTTNPRVTNILPRPAVVSGSSGTGTEGVTPRRIGVPTQLIMMKVQSSQSRRRERKRLAKEEALKKAEEEAAKGEAAKVEIPEAAKEEEAIAEEQKADVKEENSETAMVAQAIDMPHLATPDAKYAPANPPQCNKCGGVAASPRIRRKKAKKDRYLEQFLVPTSAETQPRQSTRIPAQP